MNVLMIAQYFPPDIGGASTRAFNLSKGLVKLGNTVKVVTAFPHYPLGIVLSQYKRKVLMFEEIDGIKITRVWIPSLPHNNLINRVILHLSFIFSSLLALPFIGGVDVIVAANPNLFAFFPAIVYGLMNRKHIVRNVDDLWPEVFYDMKLVKSNIFKKFLDFITWLSYVVPVVITPVSPGYKRKIMDKYNIKSEKIKVIEVGVDAENYSQYNILKKENFIVMYSGVLGLAYDFKNILLAAKILSTYKEIKFVIRGVGECEQEIKDMMIEMKLDNVSLDTHIVPKRKLIEILYLADIFLLPMKHIGTADEGLPTKIFEYQAFGKPLICCSQGESAKYVNYTKSGLVIDPGDFKALADAIFQLFKDEKLRKDLGLNGQKYVQKNLTVNKIGERFYNVLKSIGID